MAHDAPWRCTAPLDPRWFATMPLPHRVVCGNLNAAHWPECASAICGARRPDCARCGAKPAGGSKPSARERRVECRDRATCDRRRETALRVMDTMSPAHGAEE